MSSNENLICPDCINETLNEEKKLEYDLIKRNNGRDLYYNKSNNYSNYLTDEKIQKREKYTNYAMQTLSKLNSSISSKERLIKFLRKFNQVFITATKLDIPDCNHLLIKQEEKEVF